LFYLRLLAEEVELEDVVAVAALVAYPDSMNQQETNQSKKKRNSLPPEGFDNDSLLKFSYSF
jgi:hypothetical protein